MCAGDHTAPLIKAFSLYCGVLPSLEGKSLSNELVSNYPSSQIFSKEENQQRLKEGGPWFSCFRNAPLPSSPTVEVVNQRENELQGPLPEEKINFSSTYSEFFQPQSSKNSSFKELNGELSHKGEAGIRSFESNHEQCGKKSELHEEFVLALHRNISCKRNLHEDSFLSKSIHYGPLKKFPHCKGLVKNSSNLVYPQAKVSKSGSFLILQKKANKSLFRAINPSPDFEKRRCHYKYKRKAGLFKQKRLWLLHSRNRSLKFNSEEGNGMKCVFLKFYHLTKRKDHWLKTKQKLRDFSKKKTSRLNHKNFKNFFNEVLCQKQNSENPHFQDKNLLEKAEQEIYSRERPINRKNISGNQFTRSKKVNNARGGHRSKAKPHYFINKPRKQKTSLHSDYLQEPKSQSKMPSKAKDELPTNASSSVIKLIDKVLDNSCDINLEISRSSKSKKSSKPKMSKSKSAQNSGLEPFRVAKKSKIYHSRSHFRKFTRRRRLGDYLQESSSSLSSLDLFTPKYNKAISVARKEIIARPSTLQVLGAHLTNESTDQKQQSLPSDIVRSPRLGIDRLPLGLEVDGLNERARTLALLKRLDSVLSDLVEEEKRKIRSYDFSRRSKDDSLTKSSLSPHSYSLEGRKDDSRRFLNAPVRTRPFIGTYPTPSDVMDRHKAWFTELKPHKPRILKTDHKSKLRNLRCYQVPRRKSKKTFPSLENIHQHHSTKEISKDNSSNNSDYSASFEDETDSDSEEPEAVMSSEVNVSSKSSSVLHCDKESKDETRRCQETEDTSISSDHIVSSVVGFDSTQKDCYKFTEKLDQVDSGEYSIDSAYIGSRETTPDIKITTMYKQSDSFASKPTKSYGFPSYPISAQTPGKRIEEARKHLLRSIRTLGLYSDDNINSFLELSKSNWNYLPERELNIIVRSIRRDLGVQAPPKECIDYLLSKNSSRHSQRSPKPSNSKESFHYSLDAEPSTKDCITALTKKVSSLRKLPHTKYVRAASPQSTLTVKREKSSMFKSLSTSPIKSSLDSNEQERKDEDWAKATLGGEIGASVLEEARRDKMAKKNSVDKQDTNWEQIALDLCKEFNINL